MSAGKHKTSGVKERKSLLLTKKETRILSLSYKAHCRKHGKKSGASKHLNFAKKKKGLRRKARLYQRPDNTWWPSFFNALRATGDIKSACAEAEVSPKTVYAVIHRQNTAFMQQKTLAEGEYLLMELMRIAYRDRPPNGLRPRRREIGKDNAGALITYLLQFEEVAKKLRENTLWSI